MPLTDHMDRWVLARYSAKKSAGDSIGAFPFIIPSSPVLPMLKQRRCGKRASAAYSTA